MPLICSLSDSCIWDGLIKICVNFRGWLCLFCVIFFLKFFSWTKRKQCSRPQWTKCHFWCVFRQPQTTDLMPAKTINQCQSGYQMVRTKPYCLQIQTNSTKPWNKWNLCPPLFCLPVSCLLRLQTSKEYIRLMGHRGDAADAHMCRFN